MKNILFGVTICSLLIILSCSKDSSTKVNLYEIAQIEIEPEVDSIMTAKWNEEFVHVSYPTQFLDNVYTIDPGESIQDAINSAHADGGGVVLLTEGTHTLSSGITLKSKVTIIGKGRDKTTVKQGSSMSGQAFYAGNSPQLTDLLIKDLTIEGLGSGRTHGIHIPSTNDDFRHQRLMFQNITVSNWGAHGVHIKRTDNLIFDNCIFQYNGSAGGLFHNMYFLYNKYILQSDCDFSYPVLGKGCKYTSCEFVLAQNVTIKDGLGNGVQGDHEEAGYLFLHNYHISGFARVALWFPCEDFYDKFTYKEDPQYAPQNIILNRCTIVDNTWGAMWRVVGGSSYVINSTFSNEKIDMGLLKCNVTLENSTFEKGNEVYTDVEQWPEDVKILW